MYQVDEKLETIHLYVVREEEKRPYTAAPLFIVFLCLTATVALTIYSSLHPFYVRERLTIPAQFLPPKVFTAQAPIIPTGIKTYPATYAAGTLMLANGSVLSEELPQGIIFSSIDGVEIQTEQSVFIPSGSATGYGVATVSAKALVAGRRGNIQALAINAVYGTALYVRNLAAFSGGKDSYSITFITAHDREVALIKSRNRLASTVTGLHSPCSEHVSGTAIVTWRCQFITYHVPSYMHVIAVKLFGKSLLIDVVFMPRPTRVWVK